MKSLIRALSLALSLTVMAAGFAPMAVEAKRIGGGGSSGMQRSLPARTPAPAAPAQPAQAVPNTPAMAGAAPAAAAPKRSWMGPIAGLAAGLGIAALMSHLGMGAAMGNIVMLVLLAVVAFAALRFVMARMSRGAPAMATPNGSPRPGPTWNSAQPAQPAVPAPLQAAASATPLPAGFDAAAFERVAKLIFIRLQAANDSGDLNDLRAFTTPEMFAVAKLELQDRGSATQTTDVVRIDAEVLDVATEGDRQVVSVRFHGLIREETGGAAAPFDEIWNLVKPVDGTREWTIAGIQQSAAA